MALLVQQTGSSMMAAALLVLLAWCGPALWRGAQDTPQRSRLWQLGGGVSAAGVAWTFLAPTEPWGPTLMGLGALLLDQAEEEQDHAFALSMLTLCWLTPQLDAGPWGWRLFGLVLLRDRPWLGLAIWASSHPATLPHSPTLAACALLDWGRVSLTPAAPLRVLSRLALGALAWSMGGALWTGGAPELGFVLFSAGAWVALRPPEEGP